jgi:HEAT repeat protein
MRALGQIDAETTVKLLTEQLEHYRKGEGAWSALDGLAQIADPSSVPVFASRLTDKDAFIRRAAIEGLGRALSAGAADADGVKAQRPAIEAARADPSPMVRVAAAFALELLGQNGIDRLATALQENDLAPQIADYVMELGPRVSARLVPHLKSTDASIRGNVAVVLGAIGSAAEIAALEPLLQDANTDVRRAAERAIERIKVRGA